MELGLELESELDIDFEKHVVWEPNPLGLGLVELVELIELVELVGLVEFVGSGLGLAVGFGWHKSSWVITTAPRSLLGLGLRLGLRLGLVVRVRVRVRVR